jgi:hypothetical protein
MHERVVGRDDMQSADRRSDPVEIIHLPSIPPVGIGVQKIDRAQGKPCFISTYTNGWSSRRGDSNEGGVVGLR